LAAAEAVYVFDACAVIALIKREAGFGEVLSLLEARVNRCVLHGVNLCEVFYDLLRQDQELDPEVLAETLRSNGFEIDTDLPLELWSLAGRLKVQLRRVSLADCFGLALTLREGATFVSTDHHELDPVHEAGVCPIHFIR
jgi:PIN domain nuclease of toxin-antitoxin system